MDDWCSMFNTYAATRTNTPTHIDERKTGMLPTCVRFVKIAPSPCPVSSSSSSSSCETEQQQQRTTATTTKRAEDKTQKKQQTPSSILREIYKFSIVIHVVIINEVNIL